MQTAAAFLAVLLIVVVIHELGHFLVARFFKVKVAEFGVGYPPRIFSIRRGQSVYSLNLLPLGGFVRFGDSSDPELPDSLAEHSPWVRLAVIAAGPIMNIILPIFLLAIVFMIPTKIPVTDVVVTKTAIGSPAQEAGLIPGDIIREVAGKRINNSGDLLTTVQLKLGNLSEWRVERDGEIKATALISRVNPPPGEGAAGIGFIDARLRIAKVEPGSVSENIGLRVGDLILLVDEKQVSSKVDMVNALKAAAQDNSGKSFSLSVLRKGKIVDHQVDRPFDKKLDLHLDINPELNRAEPIWNAVPLAINQIGQILVMGKNELRRIVSGSASAGLAGPIGIAQITGEVARLGTTPLIFWTALISLNLAIINLLPIPALDGGRIVFVLLELIRGGRRIPSSLEKLIHATGFAVVIGLVIVVSIKDIDRIISGATF